VVLTGGTSRDWAIPANELAAYLAACDVKTNRVQPYIVDGVGKIVATGECAVMQRS